MLLAVLVHFKTYVDIYASFINYAHFSKKKKKQKFPGGGGLPYKSGGAVRRTFWGFKFVDWYC